MFTTYRITRLTNKLRAVCMELDRMDAYKGRQVGMDSAWWSLYESAVPLAFRLKHVLERNHRLLPRDESLIRHYFPDVPMESWHEFKRGEKI